MDNPISLSILIPLIPFGMTFLIFILLTSFNKTMNRLTKPVSYLIIFSILISSLFSLFFFLNKIEGAILISKYFSFMSDSGIKLHLNQLNEEIIIFIGLFSSIILAYSLFKLQRKKGYVLYVVFIGLLTSLVEATLLIVEF